MPSDQSERPRLRRETVAGTVTQAFPLVIDDGDEWVEVAGLNHDFRLGDRVELTLEVLADAESPGGER